jgi:hypothetical protein
MKTHAAWIYCSYFFGMLIFNFFEKHSTNAYTHTRTITHPYEHTHAYPATPMSIFKRLSRLNFKIHKVGHHERLAIDGGRRLPLKK